jgi:poly(hydroxyalkanoate) depolymerase family esterase
VGKLSWAFAALFLTAAGGQAAETAAGKWVGGKASAGDPDNDREYRLYIPTSYRGAPLPLVVMLHGCNQNPEIFAESTRMNGYAESGKFLVLYPAQKVTANPTRCWNWFLPRNQARDSGEPAQIVAMIEQVAKQYALDRKRIYVAGLSAGASLGATLAACYPDVFAAAAMQGGTMFKSATNLAEAGKVMASGQTPDPGALGTQAWACGGKRPLPMPVMVWHGQGDNIVNRGNGDAIVRQFTKLNDWADDGQENGSSPQGPTTRKGQVEGGHGYTVATYTHQGRPLMEYYQIAEMGHAWSGGKDDMMFSDAKGPDASLLMWNFFRQYSR